jgi:hypothetical protein
MPDIDLTDDTEQLAEYRARHRRGEMTSEELELQIEAADADARAGQTDREGFYE